MVSVVVAAVAAVAVVVVGALSGVVVASPACYFVEVAVVKLVGGLAEVVAV